MRWPGLSGSQNEIWLAEPVFPRLDDPGPGSSLRCAHDGSNPPGRLGVGAGARPVEPDSGRFDPLHVSGGEASLGLLSTGSDW